MSHLDDDTVSQKRKKLFPHCNFFQTISRCWYFKKFIFVLQVWIYCYRKAGLNILLQKSTIHWKNAIYWLLFLFWNHLAKIKRWISLCKLFSSFHWNYLRVFWESCSLDIGFYCWKSVHEGKIFIRYPHTWFIQ